MIAESGKQKQYITLPSALNGKKKERYNADWTLWQKINYIIRESGIIMFGREILNEIDTFEPTDDDSKSNRSIQTYNILLRKSKPGKDLKRIAVGKEYAYGLVEWFHDDNSVMEEHNKKTAK